jgi:hypothetical protein
MAKEIVKKCPECGSTNLKAFLHREQEMRYNPKIGEWEYLQMHDTDEGAFLECLDCGYEEEDVPLTWVNDPNVLAP